MKKAEATKKATSKKRPVRSKRKCVVFWNNLSKKRRVLLVFACLIVLSAIMYFAYAWYQGYALKKVEKKMDILTQEIVTKLGEPVSQSKEQSCGYASAKFRKGQLWCRSGSTLVYRVEASDLQPLISKIRATVSGSSNFSLIYNSEQIQDLNIKAGINPSDTIYSSRDTSCRVSYTTDSSDRNIPNENLTVSINPTCSYKPLRPIFPVKE